MAFSQANVQALLDPASDGTGIQIERVSTEPTNTNTSVYLNGAVAGLGKCQWLDLPNSNNDAQNVAAIKAAFGIS